MNSLSDFGMIDKLYEASNAGVKIQLEVRGFVLIPGVKGMSANIEAISIVDNYLEHTKFIFWKCRTNRGFISSADFMNRNLDGRVEVTSYLRSRNELIDNFDLGWKEM
jgi:polyphosphate kinase